MWRLAFAMGVGGEFASEEAKESEEEEGGDDKDGGDEEGVAGEIAEVEEVVKERNGEGGGDDSNNSDEEGGTEGVERFADEVDKGEINGKSDEEGGGEELWASKIVNFGDNRECDHRDSHSEASGDGEFFDVGDKLVFDASGVFL